MVGLDEMPFLAWLHTSTTARLAAKSDGCFKPYKELQ